MKRWVRKKEMPSQKMICKSCKSKLSGDILEWSMLRKFSVHLFNVLGNAFHIRKLASLKLILVVEKSDIKKITFYKCILN